MNVLRKGLGKLWYEMSDKQCSIYFEFTEILWLQGWDISSCPPPQQLLLQISSYGWEVVFFSSFPMHFQFLTILPIPAVVNLGVSTDKYFLENVFKVYESIVSPHPRITWFQANIVYSDGWVVTSWPYRLICEWSNPIVNILCQTKFQSLKWPDINKYINV